MSAQLNTSEPEWPTLANEAFFGFPGTVVRAIEPHTEADPAAILFQFLAAAGSIIGPGPFFQIEGDAHHGNLFVIIVGTTGKGRKGTSWGRVRQLFERVNDPWAKDRVISGLSSGEGLIHAVRDPDEAREDPGVGDKRLLVLESEFASVLRTVERQGSTLSPTIRNAWDSQTLRILTKNSPAKATGAHISIIGHITDDELKRYLTATEGANGFANRFLLVAARRSKLLPFGGGEMDIAEYSRALEGIIKHAIRAGRMTLDQEARGIWQEVYPALSEGHPGLFGAVTSRAEAQTLRLALLYAILDETQPSQIGANHLRAGLACWEYAEASAQRIFGKAQGDPVADAIMDALRAAPRGLTRTAIRDLFKRHKNGDQIEGALRLLREKGLASVRQVMTGGRSTEIWTAAESNREEASVASVALRG